MTDSNEERDGGRPRPRDADPLHPVREALGRLRFGGIQLTVHEGRLVQMEITEKRRFI